MLERYPYLYNCAECGAKVKVKPEGVKRTCSHTTATINAPRKSLLTGDGTLNGVPFKTRMVWRFRCLLTRLAAA
jgi:hypothetical protein